MQQTVHFIIQHSIIFALPVGVFILTVILGFVIREILFKNLSFWATKSTTQLDDIIIDSTRGPFLIWCFMMGLYFALRSSELPMGFVSIAGKILLVLGIISVMMVLSGISSRFIKIYSATIESTLPVTSLTQNIARIIIICVGILVILNSLGISVAPILATLGIGGLAVALALQDSLSNLFAGFHIIAAKQLRVGDYIKLETGAEGYVTDINWRNTKIRMLPNNLILVPNDKLTKSIITNYHLPEKEMSVLVELGVHYQSDLPWVEKVTCEVAKEVLQNVQGGVPDFEPFIRYHTFSDYSINFSVILRAKEFIDQYLLKHEFLKRIHQRFQKEGIIIPYPIRTIYYPPELKSR